MDSKVFNNLSYITLLTNNLKGMSEFYEKIFSWQAKAVNDSMIVFHLPNLKLALVKKSLIEHEFPEIKKIKNQKPESNNTLLSYNLSSKKDVDAWFKNSALQQGNIIQTPKTTSWGSYAGLMQDPEYNLWEINFTHAV